MRKRGKTFSKRGQVTIFIIIAIIIVALGALIYLIYPPIKSAIKADYKNPNAFIQNCMEDEIEENVEKLSLQGGSIDPKHYFLYEDEKVEYLCYTNEYYKYCLIEQPLLEAHIESEIKNAIEDKAGTCFQDLKESYEERGYHVNLRAGETIVELLPKRIVTTFTHQLTLTKRESEQYEVFRVILDNNLYEFVEIANSIIDWENAYGKAETSMYMRVYHHLKVEMIPQSIAIEGQDDTKIYILTDKNTGKKFQLASRSLALPPGY